MFNDWLFHNPVYFMLFAKGALPRANVQQRYWPLPFQGELVIISLSQGAALCC